MLGSDMYHDKKMKQGNWDGNVDRSYYFKKYGGQAMPL